MDSFFAIAIALGAAYVAFKHGKQHGTRQAFGLGRRQTFHQWSRRDRRR